MAKGIPVPPKDQDRILTMRRQGMTVREIAAEMSLGKNAIVEASKRYRDRQDCLREAVRAAADATPGNVREACLMVLEVMDGGA